MKRHGEGDISPAFVFSVLLVQQTIGALCFPISKYGLEYIDAFVFAFYRFVISSIVLFAFVKVKRHAIPIDRKDYPKIIGLGALIIPFNQTLYLWGQSMTAAGHGAFLFATVPIWIFLLAITYLKEKATWQRTLGVLVALAGVIIIMTSGETEVSTEYLLGDVSRRILIRHTPGEKHDEFVPAESCDRIRLADSALKTVGYVGEQLIACLVSESVVDRFEFIQIDEEYGEGGG